jgi:hypothetical protein
MTVTNKLKYLHKPLLLFYITAAAFSCQSKNESERTIASTHPALEDQLEKDSVRMPVSDRENPDLYERYRITMEEYERDSSYMVSEMYRGRLAPLDVNSHSDARTYRTAIDKGLKEGINFAGKYTVVTMGCGTSCQTHYVVDRETGKVLDNIQSSVGAKFSADSRLFIINAPDSTVDYKECQNCEPEPYIFEYNQFRKLPKGRQ